MAAMKMSAKLSSACQYRDRLACRFHFFTNKHDCILLTKHAMQYFSSRSKDMLNSEQSRKLKQQPDLMHKIITEMRSKEFRGSTQKRKARYQWLSRKGRGKKSKQKMSAWAQQENRSPLSNDVLLEIEGEDTISKLSAEEVRSEAKRILEAADDKQGSRSRRQRRRISESSEKDGMASFRRNGCTSPARVRDLSYENAETTAGLDLMAGIQCSVNTLCIFLSYINL
mmetsp:Transcript_21063/g.50824  ORF Transcript_21063/g.50824 Transcript_21063/m.50824 type:complete len:226 (+) Transcript_21063:619-1296(+)